MVSSRRKTLEKIHVLMFIAASGLAASAFTEAYAEETVAESVTESSGVSGPESSEDSEDESKGSGDGEDSQAGTPETLNPEGDTESTPVSTPESTPDSFLSEEYRSASRRWEAPDYSGQENRIGWSPTVFATPESLRARVRFWVDIYSKYTTEQGVLHDADHIDLVYEPLDFKSIMKNEKLSVRQKRRARKKLVEERRDHYKKILIRLAKTKTTEGLSEEELRIWKLFENVQGRDKFMAATKRNRIRFQLGQKDRFILGIYYSGRYIREMERIFRDAGLPIELTRLPFVESSFNIFARSKAGASGVWQFMRRTARPYMMVNRSVDERNDPIEATRAAARLLKSNFEMLGNWPLAVTGYNHGPHGVQRIVRKFGSNDLAEIVGSYSSRTFGFASENFYSCFLAALEVEKNAPKYFGDVKWSTSFDGTEIAVARPIPYKALLALFDNDESLARLHNFHLQISVRKGNRSVPRGTFIRVPTAVKDRALALINGSIGLSEIIRLANEREKNKLNPVGSGDPAPPVGAVAVEAVVQPGAPGESGIEAVASDGGDPRSAESRAAAKSLERGMGISGEAGGRPSRYRVRSGDTLTRISRKFGVSISTLKEVNELSNASKIRRGQWLTIPD